MLEWIIYNWEWHLILLLVAVVFCWLREKYYYNVKIPNRNKNKPPNDTM